MLEHGCAVLLLAAGSGAAFRARVPCGARGLPSCRAQSLSALLATGAAGVPAFRACQNMARRSWRRLAPVWLARDRADEQHLRRASEARGARTNHGIEHELYDRVQLAEWPDLPGGMAEPPRPRRVLP